MVFSSVLMWPLPAGAPCSRNPSPPCLVGIFSGALFGEGLPKTGVSCRLFPRGRLCLLGGASCPSVIPPPPQEIYFSTPPCMRFAPRYLVSDSNRIPPLLFENVFRMQPASPFLEHFKRILLRVKSSPRWCPPVFYGPAALSPTRPPFGPNSFFFCLASPGYQRVFWKILFLPVKDLAFAGRTLFSVTARTTRPLFPVETPPFISGAL